MTMLLENPSAIVVTSRDRAFLSVSNSFTFFVLISAYFLESCVPEQRRLSRKM